jgi:hypothetical protein
VPDIRVPLVGPSNEGIHPKADCQRTINLYPVKIEREGEKERWHLVGTPGLALFDTLDHTAARGTYVFRGRLFVVTGSRLVEVYSDGTSTEWGTIASVEGRVSICELGDDLVIGDGSGFYAFNLGTSLVTVVTDAPRGRYCFSFNQRVLYIESDSGRVYYSELNDATDVPALNFFTAENKPDDLLCGLATEDQIWLGGRDTIEVWFDAGDGDNPFQRIPGGVIHTGVLAEDTMLRTDNSIFFVGRNADGHGIVWRSQGFNLLRVSTAAVERFTENATNLTAYSYQEQGHTFYVLNADEGTWALDLKENEWHERAFLNQNNGQLERARAELHAFAFGKHIVSDYEDPKLYEQSLDYYSDAGVPLVARRVTAHTDADGKAITVDQLYIDMATGVGLNTGQGSDPQVMLRYSTDGGQNWSNELMRDAGAIGKTLSRVSFNSLGMGTDWAFEVSISDPVSRVLVASRARVRIGRRHG